MNFRGDKRAALPVGTRLGPDAHWTEHEVTEVTYDEATNTTKVRTRKLELEDQRLRFVGGNK